MTMRSPETAALAGAAYEASGCKTHEEFIALFGKDTIGLRSFRAWIKGERPAEPLAQWVLRECAAGRLPGIKREG